MAYVKMGERPDDSVIVTFLDGSVKEYPDYATGNPNAIIACEEDGTMVIIPLTSIKHVKFWTPPN